MSEINLASRLAATYVGIESVFGTAASPTIRAFPSSGSVDVSGIDQSIIQVPDQRVRGFKYVAPVLGLKSVNAAIKMECLLRPDSTQLDNTNTVPATMPWMNAIVRGALGNSTLAGPTVDSYAPVGTGAAAGCLLSGTPGTGTSISVATGKGSLFAVGQWIAVQTDAGLEPTRITAISSDTLTVSPAVTGTPVATSGKVMAGYTFGADQAHAASLTFQHALALSSAYQWQGVGCMVDSFEFSFERNAHPKVTVGMKAASWTGPSAQSFSTSAASDTMNAPFGTRNALVLLQGSAVTTKTAYVMHSFNVKLNLQMQQIPDLNSAVEGVSAVQRFPDPTQGFGTVEMTFPSDTARMTDFTSQNKLQAVFIWQSGAAGAGVTTTRFVVADCPTVIPIKAASYKDQNGRLVTTLTCALMEDESTSGSTTNLAYSPFRLAWI